MKKFLLTMVILSGISSNAFAQEMSYGLRAGVNLPQGGQITGISSGGNYTDETFNATSKIGLLAGAFLQMELEGFFLRPELVYSTLKTEFIFPGEPSTMQVNKYDFPVLIGINPAGGPVNIFGGPAFTYVTKAILEGKEMTTTSTGSRIKDGDEIAYQTFPVNLQLGASVEFDKVGLDIRYEYNLSSAEIEFMDMNHNAPGWHGINRATFDDSRLNQIIFSLTYKLGDTGGKRSRYGRSRRRR